MENLQRSIAVSASVMAQTQEESVQAGCDDFLMKPVAEAHLYRMLETYLQIEWIYEDKNDGLHLQGGVHLENIQLTPPPQEQLTILHELAMIGDIMAIREQAEALKNSAYAPFAEKLATLAKALEVSKIQQFIESYLDK